MSDINPYSLLNERERLINEATKSYSSTTILAYDEKKRRHDIKAASIARLTTNGKAIVGQNFSGSGIITSKISKTIKVAQKNSVVTYDYAGKATKTACIILIQFPNNSSFGSFTVGDKVEFSGKILKLNVETVDLFPTFAYFGKSDDIIIENISFQKQTKSDGPCFIATAVYQNYNAPVVRELRDFRNNHLLNNSLGRLFINFYYRHSPAIAKLINGSIVLRHCAKYSIVLPAYLITKLFKKTK